ncbi:replication initiation protein [Hallella colorans]|jgi:plasmid replication initiation protein|uniref:Replication initiator protein n=1 Tax=Hallella colorans TaxID=1703337 RepID=A0A2U0TJI3_9BACT|nr:replication initiation protein [Hallella colorans]PVX43761.1 replication initiator protein [Hallella colorans]
MARPIEENKNVIQSYMLTTARYDFSVYEKRILYRLVELAQAELQGKNFAEWIGMKVETNLFGDKDITMPVRYILANEEDNNYTKAKKAFKAMSNRTIEQTKGNVWYLDHMLERVRVNLGTGVAKFRVSPNVWNIVLDFTKGYRKYELKTTMQFKSVYSMRFYELLSGQNKPLNYSIDEIRKMFSIEKKLKKIDRLESVVFEVAQKELDENSPYSFTWEREEVASRGRNGKKVVGYTFYPKYIQKNRDQELEKRELTAKVGNITGPYGMLKKEVSDYLLYNMNMTKEEINANKNLFLTAQKELPNLVDELANLKERAAKNGKGIGWIINGLKGKMKEVKK